MYQIFENSGGDSSEDVEVEEGEKIFTLTAFCRYMFVCVYIHIYVVLHNN